MDNFLDDFCTSVQTKENRDVNVGFSDNLRNEVSILMQVEMPNGTFACAYLTVDQAVALAENLTKAVSILASRT